MKRRGVSVVEILISIVVLALISLGVMQGLSGGFRHLTLMEDRVHLQDLAGSVLTAAGLEDFDFLARSASRVGEPRPDWERWQSQVLGPLAPGLVALSWVEPVDDPDVLLLTVSVGWIQHNGRTRTPLHARRLVCRRDRSLTWRLPLEGV